LRKLDIRGLEISVRLITETSQTVLYQQLQGFGEKYPAVILVGNGSCKVAYQLYEDSTPQGKFLSVKQEIYYEQF